MKIEYQKIKPGAKLPVLRWKDISTGDEYYAVDTPSGLREYQNFEEMLEDIEKRRAKKRLAPLPMLREIVENHLCRLPANRIYCELCSVPQKAKNIIQGATTLLYEMMNRDKPSIEKLNNRSFKCGNCPFNNKVQEEGGTPIDPIITLTEDVLEKILDTHKSAYQLKYPNRFNGAECMACGGCLIQVKIHTGLKANLKKMSPSGLRVLKDDILFKNNKKGKCFLASEALKSKDPEIKEIIEKAWKE